MLLLPVINKYLYKILTSGMGRPSLPPRSHLPLNSNSEVERTMGSVTFGVTEEKVDLGEGRSKVRTLGVYFL